MAVDRDYTVFRWTRSTAEYRMHGIRLTRSPAQVLKTNGINPMTMIIKIPGHFGPWFLLAFDNIDLQGQPDPFIKSSIWENR